MNLTPDETAAMHAAVAADERAALYSPVEDTLATTIVLPADASPFACGTCGRGYATPAEVFAHLDGHYA